MDIDPMETVTQEDDQYTAALPNIPQPRFSVPMPMMEAICTVYTAVDELIKKLPADVGDVQPEGMATRWKRFIDVQDAFIDVQDAFAQLLRKLHMPSLATEIAEWSYALRDQTAGIDHPFFVPPAKSGSQKRRGHADTSQIWRARANLALAIEARHAILALEPSKDRDTRKWDAVAVEILDFDLARRLAAKNRRTSLSSGDVSIGAEKEMLKRMVLEWKRNLARRDRDKLHPHAVELFDVTRKLIQQAKSSADTQRLCDIQTRCLKAAYFDAAFCGG